MHLFRSFLIGLSLLACHHLIIADQYEPFEKNGKYGLKNISSGEVVITPRFQSIGWSDGTFKVIGNIVGARQNERWALINLKGDKISEYLYTSLLPFTSNLFIAAKRADRSIFVNFGLINSKGKTVIDHQYSRLKAIGDLLIASKKTGSIHHQGVLNKNGKSIIPLEYTSVKLIESGFFSVENKQKLSALYSSTGEELTAFQFESIEPLNEKLFLVKYYNRRGLIDRSGNIIVPPIYKNIQLSGDKARALPFTRWDFFKADQFNTSLYFDDLYFVEANKFSVVSGENIGIIKSDETYQYYKTELSLLNTKHGITIIKNENSGYQGAIDNNGKAILPINYDSIVVFKNFLMGEIKKPDHQNWSAYNRAGKKLSLFSYETFGAPINGIIEASRNGKVGLLDDNGQEASPFLYDSISSFQQSRAIAKYQGSYGLINEKGHWVITPYQDFMSFQNNLVITKQGSTSKIFNIDGKLLVDTYELITPLSQGYYQKTDEGLTLHNLQQEQLLEHTYDSIRQLTQDLYWLSRDGRTFFYRPSDRSDFKLDSDIERIGTFSEGYFPVLKDSQWGFIDERGNLRIANRYQDVDKFSEGLAAVKLIGKWGYVDKDENLVLQPSYDEEKPFHNGFAVIKKGTEYGLIDKNGQIIIAEAYSEIKRHDNHLLLRKDSLYGLADEKGKLIRTPQYDKITSLEGDYFLVEKNGLKGVINLKGLDVVPLTYQVIRQRGSQFIGSEESDWKFINIK